MNGKHSRLTWFDPMRAEIGQFVSTHGGVQGDQLFRIVEVVSATEVVVTPATRWDRLRFWLWPRLRRTWAWLTYQLFWRWV